MNAIIYQRRLRSRLFHKWDTSYKWSFLLAQSFPVNFPTVHLSSSVSKKPTSANLESEKLPEKFFFPHVQENLPGILIDKWKTRFRVKEVNKENSPKMIEVRECHLCSKGNKSKPDNLWKLCVFSNGGYHCFRCSESGNWSQFVSKANETRVYVASNEATPSPLPAHSSHSEESPTETTPPSNDKLPIYSDGFNQQKNYVFPHQDQFHHYHVNLLPPEKESRRSEYIKQLQQDRDRVKSYLHDSRKLNDIVLRKYFIGMTKQSFLNDDNVWIDHVCVTFPWMVPQDQIQMDHIEWSDVKEKMKKNKSEDEEEILRARTRQQTPIEYEENGVFNYIVRMKYRSLETKGLQRILPKGGMWGFFGWHTVDPIKHTSIIITEGEYDCMAVSQVIHDTINPRNLPFREIPVISLPNGCNSLPPELIQPLESFEKIYLWLDFDKSGQDAAEKFSKKLGLQRCVIVTPPADLKNPPKDANDALRQDPNLIIRMLTIAKGVTHKRIDDLSKFRKSILHSILGQEEEFHEKAAGSSLLLDEGTKTPSLPALVQKIRGFRRGELVIFSGPTGSGKTTLLSQLSLDFAKAGKPTLWGSFEVKNQNLVKRMFQQFYTPSTTQAPTSSSFPSSSVSARSKPQLTMKDLEKIYDDFEALPMDFLNFYDYISIEEIMETMEFSVERDDIQHLIIDNLQFLLNQSLSSSTISTPSMDGDNESREGERKEEGVKKRGRPSRNSSISVEMQERLKLQDLLLERFRKFATEKNVNVIVVIHPRKEEDNQPLGLSSIGGTAKATQEADLVLILQKLGENEKYLDIKKNRFNGTLGRIPLFYEETTNRYSSPLTQNLPSSSKYSKKRYQSGVEYYNNQRSTSTNQWNYYRDGNSKPQKAKFVEKQSDTSSPDKSVHSEISDKHETTPEKVDGSKNFGELNVPSESTNPTTVVNSSKQLKEDLEKGDSSKHEYRSDDVQAKTDESSKYYEEMGKMSHIIEDSQKSDSHPSDQFRSYYENMAEATIEPSENSKEKADVKKSKSRSTKRKTQDT